MSLSSNSSFLEMYSRPYLKSFLQENHIFLHKQRGQNFLLDLPLIESFVETIPPNTDIVLEIGCGLGHLTYALSQSFSSLVGVELDHAFIPFLQESFPQHSFYDEDILQFSLEKIDLVKNKNISVIGNLPYYISDQILKKIFLEWAEHIHFLGVLISEESFLRLKSSWSLTSVLWQTYFQWDVVIPVGAHVFFPQPKASSVFVAGKRTSRKVESSWSEFGKELFLFPRKKLLPVLERKKPLLWKERFPHLQEKRISELQFEEILDLFHYWNESSSSASE